MLKRKKNLEIFVHVAVWVIVLFLPFVFSTDNREKHWLWFRGYSASICLAVCIFYFNYSYFIAKTLFKQKIWRFFAVNLVIIICFVIIVLIIHKQYLYPIILSFDEKFRPPPTHAVALRNFTTFILTIGLGVAIKMTASWYHFESRRKEFEKEQLETELIHLKSQLNPHFFFNTLNNIYALIALNVDKAQLAVHQLSKLMRYVLYESEHEKILLDKEVEFINNYIKLLKLRIPDHVKLDVDINYAASNYYLAPMIFVTLVENAFKHGISADQDSFINISLSQKDNEVIFKVENSNFPKSSDDKSGSGIGLVNLKKRLDLIYDKQYKMDTTVTNDVYSTELTLVL